MKKFLKYLPVLAIFVVCTILLQFSTVAASPGNSGNAGNNNNGNEGQPQEKICHATSADEKADNPYVKLDIAIPAIFQSGHSGHDTKAVWYSGIIGDWGDIIPSFEYTLPPGQGGGTHMYPGMNLTEAGWAVWKYDCNIPMGLCHATVDADPVVYGDWSEGWLQGASGLYKERKVWAYIDYFDRETLCPPEMEYYYQCDMTKEVAAAWTAWVKSADEKTESRTTTESVDSMDATVVCSTETETRNVPMGEVSGIKTEVKPATPEVKAAVTTAVPLAETSGPSNVMAYIVQGILSLSLLGVTGLFAKTDLLSFVKRF